MKLDHKTIRIASIVIGLLIGGLVIYMGFNLFSGAFTRASDDVPRDVVVSDITQNSSKINWSTGNDTQGVIEYGTSPTALNFFAPESASGKNHVMDLTLLSPGSAYYFQIRIGDKTYDNGGVPWTFTTKTTDAAVVTPVVTASPSASITTPPKPVSTLVIPKNPTIPPSTSLSCNETDCVKICQKMGIGCTSQEFIKANCLGKVNTSSCTAITPTP